MPPSNSNKQNIPFSLEKIIMGMPEHAYVFSKEGKLLTWNNNIESLTEYSKQELAGKFVTEFIYIPDKERVIEKMMELIAEGEDKERVIEYRLTTRTGKIIPVLAMRSLVVIDGEKYIVGILFNISDIQQDKTQVKEKIAKLILLENQLQEYYKSIEDINQTVLKLREEVYLNNKEFNNKIINNLPGIFYMYEKVGETFLLKKWNNKYITDLGYSINELLNQQPQYFFTDKEMKKAAKAITQIFESGKVQVEIFTSHRNGKQIPYYYEGYLFEDNDKEYFMGVGIDISLRYALEKEKLQQKKRDLEAKELIQTKERELVASALHINRTSNIIKNTLKGIDQLILKCSDTTTCKDLNQIKKELTPKNKDNDNWQIFKLRFTEVHKNFFNALNKKHPTLTKSELKFCAYLKINLSSSQISSVLNITHEGIKKTRYRIRKKIGLDSKDSLEMFISKF